MSSMAEIHNYIYVIPECSVIHASVEQLQVKDQCDRHASTPVVGNERFVYCTRLF